MTTKGSEWRIHSSQSESDHVEAHNPNECKAGNGFDHGVRRSPTDITSQESVSGSETVVLGDDPHLIPLPSSSASASSRESLTSHPRRSSLDTLLRVGTLGRISNPAALVPLPESTTTDDHSCRASLYTDSERSVCKSSLDALEKTNGYDLVSARTEGQTGSTLLRELSKRTPDDLEITEILGTSSSQSPFASKVHDKIAAQDTSDGSQQDPTLNHQQHPEQSLSGSYTQTVKALSTHLPHLQHTLKETRHHGINIKYFDYIDGLLVSTPPYTHITDSLGASEDTKNKLRQALKDDIPEDVNLRFIIVEDLSVELIEILGSTFSISPEFFEEHLINSGWQNGKYQDREADTWITRGMEKNYTSIRWYRPTLSKSSRPNSAADRIKLLDPENPILLWTEAVSVHTSNQATTIKGVKHEARPMTNILRQDWTLKTNAEDVAPLLSPSAWEERATVWSKHLEKCQVGRLFLSGVPYLKLTPD